MSTDRRHGGGRHKQREDDARGGAREPGPGKKLGPHKRNLHISEDAAASLRVLLLVARGARERPDLTEDEIVEELIEAAWRAYDAEISAAADQEWNEEAL